MTQIWRINLKTASKINVRDFCIQKNILGIGWQVDLTGDLKWNDYKIAAHEKYVTNRKNTKGFKVAINAIKDRMEINDICYTRTKDGTYYIGIIKSEWRYDNSAEHKAADMVNIRDCQWFKLGTVDLVPGKVVNSYISGSTVQRVTGKDIQYYSKYIINEKISNYYTIEKYNGSLLNLLSSDDCEDLVAIYLQKLGYYFISSSCKKDTASYEYVLKHKDTGEKIVAQVKHGNVNLDDKKYADLDCNIYLLTTKGEYQTAENKNTIHLSPVDLENFALDNYKIMSDRIQNWINFINFNK